MWGDLLWVLWGLAVGSLGPWFFIMDGTQEGLWTGLDLLNERDDNPVAASGSQSQPVEAQPVWSSTWPAPEE